MPNRYIEAGITRKKHGLGTLNRDPQQHQPWDSIRIGRITDGKVDNTQVYSTVVQFILTTGRNPSIHDIRRTFRKSHVYPNIVIENTFKEYGGKWKSMVKDAAARAGEIVLPPTLPWPPKRRLKRVDLTSTLRQLDGKSRTISQARIPHQPTISEMRYRSDSTEGTGHVTSRPQISEPLVGKKHETVVWPDSPNPAIKEALQATKISTAITIETPATNPMQVTLPLTETQIHLLQVLNSEPGELKITSFIAEQIGMTPYETGLLLSDLREQLQQATGSSLIEKRKRYIKDGENRTPKSMHRIRQGVQMSLVYNPLQSK